MSEVEIVSERIGGECWCIGREANLGLPFFCVLICYWVGGRN
jgi:hypothetical protein